MTPIKLVVLLVATSSLISACSAISALDPFNAKTQERSKNPENAVEYVCDGNKHFFVRMLNQGKDAWLIYPDHEVNLTQNDSEKNRYVSGVVTLVINNEQTTLNDGDSIAYTGCKAQIAKK